MMNLENFFKNVFEATPPSDNAIKTFTEDHIARLAANNSGGDFNGILATVSDAYTAYFGKLASEDTKFTVQKSLTQTLDTLIGNFKKDVSETEAEISYKLHKGTPKYMEFYPNGISEYTSATKESIETLAKRFSDACDRNSASIDAATKTKFNDYLTNLVKARGDQLSKIGEVSSEKAGTAETRLALEVALTSSMHFIGFTYPTQVKKCMSFFDQSIVRPHTNHSNDGLGQVTGTISAQDGSPIAEVVIEVLSATVAKRHSKADGSYKTPNLAVGEHTLRFSKAGLISIDRDIVVNDDGLTDLDITMMPE